MYEIVGYQTINGRESGVLCGFKVHLVESSFSSVTEGYGVVSHYFSLDKVKGSLCVGAQCDILYAQSARGAYPGALIIR